MKTRNLFYHVVTAAILLAVLLLQGAGIPARSARADGMINFTGHVITDTADAFSVYAADVDGDGDLDVLSASDDDDEIAWYENDGGSPPAFTTHVITTSAVRAHSVYAADLDNDGDMDVMSAAYAGDEIAWYENDGSSPPVFTRHVIASNTDGAQAVYAADVDGDGDLDVLSASMRDDKVAWYENDGGSPPAFTSHVIATSCDGAQSVYAADVDGDSDIDVLSGCYDGDRIIWYENDGSSFPAFTGHVITTTVDAIESVYAADLDGDSDMDVLSASGGDDKIAWYENDGGSPPVFTSHVITTTADLAYEVYAADVDDDGDMDILSASHFDATIAWYENDGTSPPAFTGHVITDTASGATSVYATDVDGDGDMDVLSASRGDDRVIWWENSGPASPPSGPANSPWPMYQHDAQRTSRSLFIGPDWPYLEWSYPFATTEGGGSLPSIAPDGTIYFGKSNHLYALNPDGTLKWTYGPTPNVIWSSPAVANDGTIYVGHNGYTNGNLLAINPDGSLKWKYPAREVRSSPAIAADGTIYVGASDARLYAINPDGSLKWRYRPGFAEAYSSPAIGADGTIYIAGTKERNLHAVNPDGTTKWTYPIGTTGDTESSPTVDSNGTIYVGGSDNKLYAINPDGTPKWSYTVGDVHSIQSAAIGPDGTVYIISAAGILYAFTPAGDLKWTYTSG